MTTFVKEIKIYWLLSNWKNNSKKANNNEEPRKLDKTAYLRFLYFFMQSLENRK